MEVLVFYFFERAPEFRRVGEWNKDLHVAQGISAVAAGGCLGDQNLVVQVHTRGSRVGQNIHEPGAMRVFWNRTALDNPAELAFGDDLPKSDGINMICRGWQVMIEGVGGLGVRHRREKEEDGGKDGRSRPERRGRDKGQADRLFHDQSIISVR
jgi:hypothetical protein